jgi:hypothetical protein
MKRSPFKRRPVKRIGVTPELRELVLRRDGQCFVARIDAWHICRDQYGVRHSVSDLSKLTLDHVNDTATMGSRAPDDAQHLVAMCAETNIAGPSRAIREAERTYLRSLYDHDA